MFSLDELYDISNCVSYTLCSPFVTCDEKEERLMKLFHKVKNLILTELICQKSANKDSSRK